MSGSIKTSPPPKSPYCVYSILMITMFTINVGNFYTFDSPQLFEDVLIDYFDASTLQIGYLYTIYSVPNFIGAPLGGVLLSNVGVAVGSIILNAMIFLSTIGCFFGIYF